MTSSDPGAASSRWEPPALAPRERPAPRSATDNRVPTDELERLRQEARDAGYAEGLAAGRARVEASAGELSQLVEALAHPFRATDAALLRNLVDLVERVVRAVLQRELAAGLDLEPVLREALAALDESSGPVEILVSPADKALLDSLQTAIDASVTADPSVASGGLILRSASSTVDATLDARLEEAMATVRDAAGVAHADEAGANGRDGDGQASTARGGDGNGGVGPGTPAADAGADAEGEAHDPRGG